jgi:hypothetical protein
LIGFGFTIFQVFQKAHDTGVLKSNSSPRRSRRLILRSDNGTKESHSFGHDARFNASMEVALARTVAFVLLLAAVPWCFFAEAVV